MQKRMSLKCEEKLVSAYFNSSNGDDKMEQDITFGDISIYVDFDSITNLKNERIFNPEMKAFVQAWSLCGVRSGRITYDTSILNRKDALIAKVIELRNKPKMKRLLPEPPVIPDDFYSANNEHHEHKHSNVVVDITDESDLETSYDKDVTMIDK